MYTVRYSGIKNPSDYSDLDEVGILNVRIHIWIIHLLVFESLSNGQVSRNIHSVVGKKDIYIF